MSQGKEAPPRRAPRAVPAEQAGRRSLSGTLSRRVDGMGSRPSTLNAAAPLTPSTSHSTAKDRGERRTYHPPVLDGDVFLTREVEPQRDEPPDRGVEHPFVPPSHRPRESITYSTRGRLGARGGAANEKAGDETGWTGSEALVAIAIATRVAVKCGNVGAERFGCSTGRRLVDDSRPSINERIIRRFRFDPLQRDLPMIEIRRVFQFAVLILINTVRYRKAVQ